jgi:DNA-binding Lrp family transcriptional regulator
MHAYILVQLAESQEREVLDEFSDMPQVEEAHILFGEWDLIIKMAAKNPEDVASFVIEKIRKNPAVSLTSTLIVAK